MHILKNQFPRLHIHDLTTNRHQASVIVLVVASLLVTSRQYIGNLMLLVISCCLFDKEGMILGIIVVVVKIKYVSHVDLNLMTYNRILLFAVIKLENLQGTRLTALLKRSPTL